MDKIKKILVFATIGILTVLIIACLVFAIMGNNSAFMACAWSIVVLPCLIYAILLIAKVFGRKSFPLDGDWQFYYYA